MLQVFKCVIGSHWQKDKTIYGSQIRTFQLFVVHANILGRKLKIEILRRIPVKKRNVEKVKKRKSEKKKKYSNKKAISVFRLVPQFFAFSLFRPSLVALIICKSKSRNGSIRLAYRFYIIFKNDINYYMHTAICDRTHQSYDII